MPDYLILLTAIVLIFLADTANACLLLVCAAKRMWPRNQCSTALISGKWPDIV